MHPTPRPTPQQVIDDLRRQNAALRRALIAELRRIHRTHSGHPAECRECGDGWAVAMGGERVRG